MQNVNMKVEGSKLIIEVDLTQNHGPSKSGKSDTVASTHGFAKIPGTKDTRIGLNVFNPR
jgi:hypothetical protein